MVAVGNGTSACIHMSCLPSLHSFVISPSFHLVLLVFAAAQHAQWQPRTVLVSPYPTNRDGYSISKSRSGPQKHCTIRVMGLQGYSETVFYAPPLEGKIATDTLMPLPAPVVYNISGPMGGGLLYTTGAEAENSAVNFSKSQYHHCIKIGLPVTVPLNCTSLVVAVNVVVAAQAVVAVA